MDVSKKFLNKKDIIIRHIVIALLSALFAALSYTNAPKDIPYLWLKVYAAQFLFIASIWNINLLLMDWVHVFLGRKNHIRKKLIAAFVIAILLPSITHIIYGSIFFKQITGYSCSTNSKENIAFLIISIVITMLVNSIYISIEFFNHWKKTVTEKEELKRSNIIAEFETLKSQVNPHFLFNCLNTLTSLIEENPKTASSFVQKLSSVYRYVLANIGQETVLLNEELEFIKSYIYLNVIRFGDNIQATIDIKESCLNKQIPTLTLQILIENCIKHNIISQSKPLHIFITCDGEYVSIKNNFQPKIILAESTGIGLQNIISRYSFLSDKEVYVTKNEDSFCVSVPLI